MAEPLLKVAGATKRYGASVALDDASLELLPGEVHALIGENGAGKSTLIKILAGVTQPDHAEISLRGRALRLKSPADAFRQGLRFIHQELNVTPQLSVAENIFAAKPYPQRAGLIDWRRLNKEAGAALAGLGLRHLDPRTKVGRLAPGDRMLVQLAATLLDREEGGATVYVMDEPTAALNAEEARRLFGVLGKLTARGCAVLYVTHRLDEVFKICDRVSVMRDGRTVASASLGELTRRDLVCLMIGRDLAQGYPPRDAPLGETPLLEVRGLSSATLDDINFTLHRGEILGVAGLAGAGKNDLVKALMGAEGRRAGEVRLAGAAVRLAGPASAWAKGFALVPEERRAQGLMLGRSVRDNVTLPHLGGLSLAGVWLERSREEAVVRVQAEAVRLKATGVGQRVAQLSGGNQQKVLFGRATAGQPRVLLLCEPTRGVDVGAKQDIYRLIRELSRAGVGILLSSSDFPELLGLCDRILVMQGRRQAALVAAAGLSQERLLALCYGEGDSPEGA